MKLYYSPGACSLSPHIVLHEAGLAHDVVKVDLKAHQLEDGTDYYTLNSKGYVPMLELDSGERLTEGPAIVQYLADRVPDKQLAPANGTLERYRVQEWLNFIGNELHKTVSPLFNSATPDAVKAAAREKVLGRFKWVDQQLEGKSYLMGERFSVADAYLFVITNWAQHLQLDLSGLRNITALRERMQARPAVQAALKMEGLLE